MLKLRLNVRFATGILVLMKSNAKPVTFSLDVETLQAIDDTRVQLGDLAPGMRVGRSDALRVLLRRALATTSHTPGDGQ